MSAIDPIPSLNGSGSGPRMSMMQLYQQQLYAEPQPAPPQANAIAPLMMMLAQQIMAMLVQQLMQSLQAMQGQQGMPPGSPGGGGGGGLGGGGAFAPTGGPAGGSAASPNGSGGPGGSGNTSPLPGPSSTPPAQAPATPHAPTSPTSPTSSSHATSVQPTHSGEVAVNKPIVVGAGETFDGRNQLFTAGSGLSGNSAETYQPVFILGPGATLKNVQFQGGDGIHLLGDAKIDNVHAVHGGPDDMITIDGPGNRARDAQLAGISPGSIPSRPAEVEITNSSFRHSHDKAIQVNGDANVKLRGVHADDVGQLLVTLGGQPIKAHVSIEDSHFSGVRSHLVRLDDRASTLDIGRNVSTDTGRIQVMMGSPGNASGATVVMPSTDAVGN